MTEVKKQLVVFDFDWSLVDQDSDRWIFEVLSAQLRREMKKLKPTWQWTDLVAHCLEKLHAEGKTREDIEGALKILPFHPAMIRGIKNLKARHDIQTTFFCLSNANIVFIKTILASKGLADFFDEIVTNPADWQDSGLLKVRRRIDPDSPQHTCKIGCSPNMCKGDELDAFLARRGESFDRIIYIGDGNNDFCPVLHLRPQDFIYCRKNRGLEKKIANHGEASGMQCQVKYWSGAWQVEEFFDTL